MTVLITGPTRGLGRHTTLALAGRTDLLLVGRPGTALNEVADEARARGSDVRAIGCDLANLADVRAAAATARQLLGDRPLRAVVANAGAMSADTRTASADGYELTFAVNYLAHAQLIATLPAPERIVLLGSNTYHANIWRRILGVPEAQWRDPIALAQPAAGTENPGMKAAGTAYSNAKLAILYYAHELQRRLDAEGAPTNVSVFEPGWMPGTALSRSAAPALQAIGRVLSRLPGVSTPERSGPLLASLALDDKWARARDGAFVLKNKVVDVKPVAHDRDRERRLWEATNELLARTTV